MSALLAPHHTYPFLKKVGNLIFALFLLVLMLDPSNSVLQLKDKLFILFLGFNILFFRPDWRFLPHILGVFLVITLGYIFAEMQGTSIDYEYLNGVFKSMAPLTLLLWVRHYDVLRLSIFPALITTIVILTLYALISSSPIFEFALFTYSQEHNEMVMITRRNWLGVQVFGMYYRSIVSLIPVLYWVLFASFTQQIKPFWRKLGYTLLGILLTIAFFISGTRAMMLTPLFIIGLISYNWINKRPKTKYFFYPLLVLAGIAFLLFIGLLATQKGDVSNAIKYGHLSSYLDLFNEHPEYLFWGQGTGTLFYSEGFRRLTAQTEWIYIELLRNYGLLAIAILAVYLYPLKVLFHHRKNAFNMGLFLTYFAFLLVAGTNPFLLNSQGMTVLWMMYAHIIHLRKSTSIPLASTT